MPSSAPRSMTACIVFTSSRQSCSDGTCTSSLMSIGPIRRCTTLVSAGQLREQLLQRGCASWPRQPRQTTRRRTFARTVPPL